MDGVGGLVNAEDRTQLDLLESRVMSKLNELASQVTWFIKQYERDQQAVAKELAVRNAAVDKTMAAHEKRMDDIASETEKNSNWRHALPIGTILFAATAVLSITALLLKS